MDQDWIGLITNNIDKHNIYKQHFSIVSKNIIIRIYWIILSRQSYQKSVCACLFVFFQEKKNQIKQLNQHNLIYMWYRIFEVFFPSLLFGFFSVVCWYLKKKYQWNSSSDIFVVCVCVSVWKQIDRSNQK